MPVEAMPDLTGSHPSRPVNWKNQTLTPNPDSIYFMTFVNTRTAGPLVIDIPPAEGGSLAVNIVTTWQMPLEDAGPEGVVQGSGDVHDAVFRHPHETAPGVRSTAPVLEGCSLVRS